MSSESPRGRREELFQALGNEIRASQNRTERFDGSVCDLLGINRSDNTALDLIDRAGSLAAGELARQLGLTTGAVTALIDRLEKLGYVRRVPDPNDRRRVLLELTDLSKRIGELIYGPVAQEFRQIARRYTVKDLEVILDFIQIGNAQADRRQARLRELAPQVQELLSRSPDGP